MNNSQSSLMNNSQSLLMNNSQSLLMNKSQIPSKRRPAGQISRPRSARPSAFQTPSALAGRKQQAGVVILEALIAMLIFSIGVLGIVGLQARSVQGLGEAGFRSQAVQHADDLISEMWTSDPGRRRTLYQSATPGLMYQAWASQVMTGSRKLPGAAANPPTVVVTSLQTPIALLPGSSFFTSDVTITITWVPPGAAAGVTSQYVTTARILEPQL